VEAPAATGTYAPPLELLAAFRATVVRQLARARSGHRRIAAGLWCRERDVIWSRQRDARRAMPTVFGYHDVKDTDHWLASPKREEFLGPLGVTNIRTFVDPENRTLVGVLMDVPAMAAVMAARTPRPRPRRWRTTASCRRRSSSSPRPDRRRLFP
jgi:hypothetical protein